MSKIDFTLAPEGTLAAYRDCAGNPPWVFHCSSVPYSYIESLERRPVEPPECTRCHGTGKISEGLCDSEQKPICNFCHGTGIKPNQGGDETCATDSSGMSSLNSPGSNAADEVQPSSAAEFRVEEGKFYQMRNGEIVGPLEKTADASFKKQRYATGTYHSWDNVGKHCDQKGCQSDLIREVPDPALPKPEAKRGWWIEPRYENTDLAWNYEAKEGLTRLHAADDCDREMEELRKELRTATLNHEETFSEADKIIKRLHLDLNAANATNQDLERDLNRSKVEQQIYRNEVISLNKTVERLASEIKSTRAQLCSANNLGREEVKLHIQAEQEVAQKLSCANATIEELRSQLESHERLNAQASELSELLALEKQAGDLLRTNRILMFGTIDLAIRQLEASEQSALTILRLAIGKDKE